MDTLKGYSILASNELHAVFANKTKKQLEGKRHLMLLAPFLPPYDNGGVYRPLSWIQYAADNDWDVSVLTRRHKGEASKAGEYLLQRMPGEVTIDYWIFSNLKPSWKLFPRTDGDFLGALLSVDACQKILIKNPPTAIVATGPSFDFFVTAFYLSRIFKAKLILDYRDEWTLSPFRNVQCGNTDGYWEKRCLKAADLVFFTTNSMMEYHIETFPGILEGKASVLHNGWDTNDLEVKGTPVTTDKPQKRITYAGTLGHATLPESFLTDYAKVFTENSVLHKAFALYFMGMQVPKAIKQLDAFPFQDNLKVEGQFPKHIANRMIRESDVLLMLTPPDMARYIPGKLFEYIASGIPIIVHGAKGEVSRIVTELDAGFFIPTNDTDALRKALEEILTSPKERWQSEKRHQWSMAHTRQKLAKDFFGLIADA